MKQPRTNRGVFGSTITNEALDQIIVLIKQEMLLEDIRDWVADAYHISEDTAVRWIFLAYSKELRDRKGIDKTVHGVI